MATSIKAALAIGAAALVGVCDRPRFEAAILLGFVLGLERAALIVRENDPIGVDDRERFLELVARRAKHEPIEYITGTAGFYARTFLTAHGVLIPRPETELLVDLAAGIAAERGVTKIAEIGTGSGAIAVMLAILLPFARITATDINPTAIDLARRNAERFSVADRILFVQADLLGNLGADYEMVVSNPPYIAASYDQPKALGYEPQNALVGGAIGTEILEAIVALRAPLLACECGYDQEAPLSAALAKNGYKSVSFYRDYADLTRGFFAERE
ncbi:N5-glutamine S-adenosyl-L-methionine-dependent methyltransferase [Campylobacterota bacterium]|nr:N5-glutamine S-adenosyl-L-methionine-dependent methyltransferase [Campylobacterota bacterium]